MCFLHLTTQNQTVRGGIQMLLISWDYYRVPIAPVSRIHAHRLLFV